LHQDQHKIIKCKFKDQEETRATPDEDAAADAAANAATPTIPPQGSAAAAAGRVEPPAALITASSPAPSPGGTGKGKRVAWGGRKNARSLRLMPIKLVCLNLNRCDTRQQPAPACRPAGPANQNAAAKKHKSMYIHS